MTRSEDGFTLVEMLATLVLMAMMAWMLIAGPVVGRGAWTRLERRAEATQSVADAQAVLRGRLEDIYPAALYSQGAVRIDLQGDRDRLSFLAPPPDQARPGPLRRYTLALDRSDQLTLTSITDVPGSAATADTAVLAAGAEALDIAYFGPGPPDDALQWQRSWRDRSTPPLLIRIRLAFRPGDRRYWPDLIVHPSADIDADCMLNAATGHCLGRA